MNEHIPPTDTELSAMLKVQDIAPAEWDDWYTIDEVHRDLPRLIAEIRRLRAILAKFHLNTKDPYQLSWDQSRFKLRVIHNITKGEER